MSLCFVSSRWCPWGVRAKRLEGTKRHTAILGFIISRPFLPTSFQLDLPPVPCKHVPHTLPSEQASDRKNERERSRELMTNVVIIAWGEWELYSLYFSKTLYKQNSDNLTLLTNYFGGTSMCVRHVNENDIKSSCKCELHSFRLMQHTATAKWTVKFPKWLIMNYNFSTAGLNRFSVIRMSKLIRFYICLLQD